MSENSLPRFPDADCDNDSRITESLTTAPLKPKGKMRARVRDIDNSCHHSWAIFEACVSIHGIVPTPGSSRGTGEALADMHCRSTSGLTHQ